MPHNLVKNDGVTRVLIVDDSAFARIRIARALTKHPDIEVVGQAVNGEEGVQKARELHPDVVTLDVEMPQMDGLAALEAIMSRTPTAVVMVSSLTGPQTEATLRALELGAVDFHLKSSLASPVGDAATQGDLTATVLNAASARVRRIFRLKPATLVPTAAHSLRKRLQAHNRVVVVGTSTGGPRALAAMVPMLPADLPAP